MTSYQLLIDVGKVFGLSPEQIQEFHRTAHLASFAETMSDGAWKPYKWAKYACDVIEEKVRAGNARIILNVPPGFGKSQIGSIWLPAWFLHWDPDKNVLSSSHTHKLASSFSRKVRDIVRSDERIRAKVRTDVASVSDWITEQGGEFFASGVGGPILGKRFDLITIDDPVKNEEDALSENDRDKKKGWVRNDVYSRMNSGCSIVIIMQRRHEDDLSGWLIKEFPEEWTVIRFPALAEEDDVLGRKPGESLCPELFTVEEILNRKKISGSRSFATMYQQRPAPVEGGIAKRDWIQHWVSLPERQDEWLQSWDMSFKETKSGSYVVGQTWCRSRGDFYLVDQFRERCDFTKTIEAVLRMRNKWPQCRRILVEDKANGSAVISSLQRDVPGIIPVNVVDSKEARLHAVSPVIESGNVFFPHTHWIGDFVEELLVFPNGRSDDQVDSMTMALNDFLLRSASNTSLDLGGGELSRVSNWRGL